jgi:tetratricopeptide (TPR) repeat protein
VTPENPGADIGESPAPGEVRIHYNRRSSRTVLIRLGSRVGRLIVLVVTLVGAAWMAKVIVSPGIADYLPQNATTVPQLERALAWAPREPDRRLRLAQAYLARLDRGDIGRAQAQLETALRVRPTHAWTWFQLALLADREGDAQRARQAFDTAIQMDRHNVWLRWEAALLALRWGDRETALDHLKYVLAVDPAQRDAAFQLARTLLTPGEPVVNLLPTEAEPLAGILATAVRQRDLAVAQAAWERRAPLAPGIPRALQREYLDLLMAQGQGEAARRLWLAMVPEGHPGAPENLIWNGGFEARTLLNWGFDWQVRRAWGVEVTLDRFVAARGRHSLRLAFNSPPTLDFAGVWQMVAVEPGREYALRALARALDFNTRSGLKLQVATPDGERVLAESPKVAGTTPDWVVLETRVHIPENLSLIRVRLRREKAPDPEGNLGGKVWIDEVSVTQLGGLSALSADRAHAEPNELIRETSGNRASTMSRGAPIGTASLSPSQRQGAPARPRVPLP